jgi:hypothetical protein
MRAVCRPFLIWSLICPLAAAAEPAPASSASTSSDSDIKAAVIAYTDSAQDADSCYQAFALSQARAQHADTCIAYDKARSRGSTLREYLTALPTATLAQLQELIGPYDKRVSEIGEALALVRPCPAGAASAGPSGRTHIKSPPSEPMNPVPKAGLGPSGSKHRNLGLFIEWREDKDLRRYFLADDKQRVEFRPSLLRMYLDASDQSAQPILGKPDPDTVASDVATVIDLFEASPGSVQNSFLPLFTKLETRVLTESALSAASIPPEAVQELQAALRATQTHGQSPVTEAQDRERSVDAWLGQFRAQNAPVEAYEQLLEGQKIDLALQRNGHDVLLQVRPNTPVESSSEGALQIGTRQFRAHELKNLSVYKRER